MEEREEGKEGSREQIGQNIFSESRVFFKLFWQLYVNVKFFKVKN